MFVLRNLMGFGSESQPYVSEAIIFPYALTAAIAFRILAIWSVAVCRLPFTTATHSNTENCADMVRSLCAN